MNHPSYPAILEKLSQLEDPYEIEEHDLLALGITTEMIPDLIETILDEKYYSEDYPGEDLPQLFAYVALGQLKTPAAIDGLIAGVKRWAHSNWFEWFCEVMPAIFGKIGPIAIPPLIELLEDTSQSFDARTSALQYLYPISLAHPEERDRCIAAIVKVLENFADNDPEFNGYIVMNLVADYKAVTAAPIIEAAYAADRVDYAFVGGWDDAQVYLGLRAAPDPKPPNYFDREVQRILAKESSQIDAYQENRGNDTRKANAKKKAKRQQEKKSRQKNRRK